MTTATKHILLIDDNEDILFMLKAMLQFKGYRVSVKDNATDLENHIKELMPEIILMDMLLSGANGCELCKQIKANPLLNKIPILMISAMPNADNLCFAAGANYFVAKPFEMEKMLATVAIAFENK